MVNDLKLGLHLTYWGSGPPDDTFTLVRTAHNLGYESVWLGEVYGSDAITPLAALTTEARGMRFGTGIAQMAARPPAAAAMAAMTMDHLSDGRFVLGLGVSGPQVVEGWYGQPFQPPLGRTREYVEIVRRIIAREEPVTFDGDHYPLPYPDGTGLGKPLKSTLHPRRTDLPILLGAEGPKNMALAGEIADGWFAMFFSTQLDGWYRERLAEGFARPGARRNEEDFEVVLAIPTAIGDDVVDQVDSLRPLIALYVGGMGAKEKNFHFELACRMGYEGEAEKIREHYLAGEHAESFAAVPAEMVEEIALVGPVEKIRDDLEKWRETCITTLLIPTGPDKLAVQADEVDLATMAELILG